MTKEILKFSISKKDMQFPVDEIINEKDRLARAWVSVETKDKDGDIIPISDMRKTMNTWMKRNAPISDSHSNRIIGKGLNWTEREHPKTGKPGIEIDYQIFDDYTIDDQVWEEIKSGKRSGLSFGGRATKESKLVKVEGKGDDGGMARELAGIEGYEISSVTDPANQHALNTKVNFLAKSENKENEEDNMNKTEIKKEIVKDIIDGLSKSLDTKKQDGGHLHSSEDPTGEHMHSKKNESEDLKTKECKDKYKEDNQEGSKVKKQDEMEDKKPDAGETNKEEGSKKEDDRVAILEDKLEKLTKMISKIAKADDSEEEDTKKEEDKKDDEEVDKEGSGEKVVTEAPAAGETNETATEEGDKVTITEKSLKKMMDESINKALKGIQKVSTPRPVSQDIKKTATVEKPKEMAMEFLKKAKEGTISPAEMTRAIKKQAMAHKEAKGEMLKKIIAQEDE